MTGWPPSVARAAALEVFGLWLEGRGGAGAHEASEAVARVRHFLIAHGTSRFEQVDETTRTVNRAGWRRPGLFYIAPDVWREEVNKGAGPKAGRAGNRRGRLP